MDITELEKLKTENTILRNKLEESSTQISSLNLLLQEASSTQVLKDKNLSLQKALSEQNKLLLNVANSISDLLFYKDTDYRYIGCNQAFSNFLGLPMDYIIGKTDYELFSKEQAELFRSIDVDIFQSFTPYSNNQWITHANGNRLYLVTQKSPLIDDQGDLIGMVGISRDLTKELDLEEKLQQSNNHLNDAQRIAKVGHWDWDMLNDKLSCSDEVYRIFGVSPKEFDNSYNSFFNMIHPDDKKMVASEIAQALKERENYDIYHRIILPDNTEKIIHGIGHALYNNSGTPIRIIGTTQDLTALKDMETKLEEQIEAFETIFEHSSDAISLLEDGKSIACNQATVNIMGLANKQEYLNTHPSALSPKFQPDGRLSYEKAEEMMQVCLLNGHHRFEWLHSRKNGEEFWMDILLTRININTKPIIHVSGRDISEQKKLESSLENSKTKYKELARELDLRVKEQSAQMIKQSRMAHMGELLSMIAHQWRQPLSSISAIASSIKVKLALSQDDAINETNRDYLNRQADDIEAFTQSLSNTINDFRTLYKPDKIKQYHHITDPIEYALKLTEMSFTKNAIDVNKNYDTDLSLQMHKNEIMQVMLNLFKNSEDNFLEKNISRPCIDIHTFSMDGYVKIEVSDNAGGIEESAIEKIFDPYFSTKNDKNGTGLGLYMSKTIIEQHHDGKIYAYNTDKGACFCIELPLL